MQMDQLGEHELQSHNRGHSKKLLDVMIADYASKQTIMVCLEYLREQHFTKLHFMLTFDEAHNKSSQTCLWLGGTRLRHIYNHECMKLSIFESNCLS
jgi:hypothetical protein